MSLRTELQKAMYRNAAYVSVKAKREKHARDLAQAYEWAIKSGWRFTWEHDELDSSEWSDEKPAWPQWRLRLRDADGAYYDGLGGVDFGRDGSPFSGEGYEYARVCQAELAL